MGVHCTEICLKATGNIGRKSFQEIKSGIVKLMNITKKLAGAA
ncbi:hypothetical protein B4119_4133 [Parageobacillus caldoxylosilyticus]|uniref:Uncharacterized protein n=1 Tax=Saccharococcus caldoxylosilyticus TaxID=81408 RepID=A0A150LMR7_9BACL|nr:hypothetical protein B4119_4133 [Parageobacillus caldoxylosilyticus]